MDAGPPPTLSKWACIFHASGRARYLDMYRVFADGTLENTPYGSINLDAPLVLLRPGHPDLNSTRPSEIAQACGMFMESSCYKLLRMVEDDINEKGLFQAHNAIFYTAAELDSRYEPAALYSAPYGEALSYLRQRSMPAIGATPAPAFNRT